MINKNKWLRYLLLFMTLVPIYVRSNVHGLKTNACRWKPIDMFLTKGQCHIDTRSTLEKEIYMHQGHVSFNKVPSLCYKLGGWI